MLKNKNGLVCDYCNKKYRNQTELATHHFFHVDQDVEALLSSLNELDESYFLPSACKARPTRLSTRVVEMDEKNLPDGSPKPRRMSDRIDEVISLSQKYPLEKSVNAMEVEFTLSDEEDDKNPTAEHDKTSIPDSQKSASSSSKSQMKLRNVVLDKDSTPKSHYFKHHLLSTQSVFYGVKNPDFSEVTALDHLYSKQCPKSDLDGSSSFMESVENEETKDPLSYKLASADSCNLSDESDDDQKRRLDQLTESEGSTCNDVKIAYSNSPSGVYYDQDSEIFRWLDELNNELCNYSFSPGYYSGLN